MQRTAVIEMDLSETFIDLIGPLLPYLSRDQVALLRIYVLPLNDRVPILLIIAFAGAILIAFGAIPEVRRSVGAVAGSLAVAIAAAAGLAALSVAASLKAWVIMVSSGACAVVGVSCAAAYAMRARRRELLDPVG